VPDEGGNVPDEEPEDEAGEPEDGNEPEDEAGEDVATFDQHPVDPDLHAPAVADL
jgi:hypothetical protein